MKENVPNSATSKLAPGVSVVGAPKRQEFDLPPQRPVTAEWLDQ
jgi:hypothetical protein